MQCLYNSCSACIGPNKLAIYPRRTIILQDIGVAYICPLSQGTTRIKKYF